MERIRIDQVVTDRDIDAAEPLPNDPNIVRVPIVVSRGDMVLIDGLRRLKYWRDSGAKTIAVILVSSLDEACDALEPQHAGRDMKPRQLWNILRIIYPWGIKESNAERVTRIQLSKKTGISHRRSFHTGPPLRMRMVKVLSASSGHQIERTWFLYRAAANGNPLAAEMAREVDEGKRGIYNASKVVSQGNMLQGSIREVTEQKTLLDNGSRNLGAQVGALLKLGSPVLVKDEDLENFIQSLSASRSKLTTFINQLKAIHRERTHG